MRQTVNSKKVPINVVGASTFGRYPRISSESTYNMFVSDGWLVNFAGHKKVYDLVDSGQGRGIFLSIRANILIVVVNSFVYRIEPNLSPTLIGTLVTNIGQVFIAENLNNQICIVDGINAYVYNHSLPPNLTIQALADGLIPTYVSFHNTFFNFGNGDKTGNGAAWYSYSFDTDTTIQLTSTQALQTKPDYAVAVMRLPGQSDNVIVFGTCVSEIFTHVGGLQNYRRNSSRSIDFGALSINTIAASDKYVAWLGANEDNSPVLVAYSVNGFTQLSVADGIDYLMSRIQFPKDSCAMFRRVDGHVFYQITFFNPADNLTLAYDFESESFYDLTDQHMNFHPARNYAYFNQHTYFISLTNAALYEASSDITVYDENINGNNPALIFEIPRVRICATYQEPDNSRFIANAGGMTIEQGTDESVTGLSLMSPGLPYQPRVDITLSRDGGYTWGNTVSRTMNPIGIRQNMLTWEKMGQANVLTHKFRFWGMSRFIVNDGYMEIYQ